MPNMPKVTKLRMSDGVTYTVYDEIALHMDENGNVLTNIPNVNYMIINMGLKLMAVNGTDVAVTNVLSRSADGEIVTRDADKLLKDIGGYSCSVDNEVLSLKLGK